MPIKPPQFDVRQSSLRGSHRLSELRSGRLNSTRHKSPRAKDIPPFVHTQSALNASDFSHTAMGDVCSPPNHSFGALTEHIPFSSDSPRPQRVLSSNDETPSSFSANSSLCRREMPSSHSPSHFPFPPQTNEWSAPSKDACAAVETFLVSDVPKGRSVVLNLLSTWGDAFEVGVNGVEIFDQNGIRLVPCAASSTSLLLPFSANIGAKERYGGDEERGQEGNCEDGNGHCIHARVSDPTTDAMTNKNCKNDNKNDMSSKNNMVQLYDERSTWNGYTTLSSIDYRSGVRVVAEFPAEPGEEVTNPQHENPNHTSCSNELHEKDKTTDDERARCSAGNLLNDVVNSHDESKLFLMPFSPHGHHLIGFLFSQTVEVSMIRLHNYSGRGRVHTTKGVRLLEVSVDDALVFRGEIAKSTGEVMPPHRVGLENCENILFTEDPTVLRGLLSWSCPSRVSHSHEEIPPPLKSSSRRGRDETPVRCSSPTTVLFSAERNDTTQRIGNESPALPVAAAAAAESQGEQLDDRVNNTIFHSVSTHAGSTSSSSASTSHATGKTSTATRDTPVKLISDSLCCPTQVESACLMLLGTWGDTEHIGLTGLRFRDAQGNLVSHRIAHWFVRFPSIHGKGVVEKNACSNGTSAATRDTEAIQQQEDHNHTESTNACVDMWTRQLRHLFDEDAMTSIELPYERGVEIIFIFDPPLPTLGFIEVANYSRDAHTFCGVKEARLFLSAPHPSLVTSTNEYARDVSGLVMAYAALWSPARRTTTTSILSQHDIFEITPEEGVILRKAPAYASIPRFQTFDLSSASAYASASVDARGGHVLSASLSASLTIRAAMAMRRARMTLKPRPDWLVQYQPYLTPLLPVGYVMRVALTLSARGGEGLKRYAKAWMGKPARSCTMGDANGERIATRSSPRRRRGKGKSGSPNSGRSDLCDPARARLDHPGSPHPEAHAQDAKDIPNHMDPTSQARCQHFITEVLFAVLPTASPSDAAASHAGAIAPLLHASLSLVYVADIPFGVSVVSLNAPLVAQDGDAWVRRVCLFMDDTLIFDSGDVGVPRQVAQRTTVSSFRGEWDESSPSLVRNGDAPTYRTQLRPLVFFTLDSSILDEARDEVESMI